MRPLASGLTAYNHNLDTSREFYPEVRRDDQCVFSAIQPHPVLGYYYALLR